MCSAEMVASIRRCRARTRPGRSSARVAGSAVAEVDTRAAALTEARRRTGQAHFRDPRAQQIVELEHPGLDLRERPRPVMAVGDTALQALAQLPVLVVDLHVDAVSEPADQAHLAPIVGQPE